jgi:hypothetical protein
MSAAEWLSQTDVRAMLALAARWWLCPQCHNSDRVLIDALRRVRCWSCEGSPKRSPLTPRKLRLIACAACRFLGDELTGEPAREAVAIAELFADGLSTPAQLARAGERATAPAAGCACQPGPWHAACAAVDEVLARLASLHEARLSADLHAELTQVAVNAEARCGHLGRGAIKVARKAGERRFRAHFAEQLDRARQADRRALCAVVYDLLGNPFDPSAIARAWLEADGGRVRQVAAGIEREGCFAEMAVLGDALQDAGCADARLLDHCLEDRHYRGCWVVDLLLNKE